MSPSTSSKMTCPSDGHDIGHRKLQMPMRRPKRRKRRPRKLSAHSVEVVTFSVFVQLPDVAAFRPIAIHSCESQSCCFSGCRVASLISRLCAGPQMRRACCSRSLRWCLPRSGATSPSWRPLLSLQRRLPQEWSAAQSQDTAWRRSLRCWAAMSCRSTFQRRLCST